MSRNKENDICFYLMGIGLFVFYKSFKQIKLHRRIKDTSTSKIASAALGDSVEIHGKVISDPAHLVTSPLSGKKCVAFLWKLEKKIGGKNQHWALQYRFFSTPYIYVTDESKAVAALDLSSCAFQEDLYGHTVNFNDSSFEIPADVLTLLKNNGMITGEKSFLFSDRYRLIEKIISPGDSYYILGRAGSTPSTEKPFTNDSITKMGKRNLNLKGRLKAAFETRKADPEMIQKYDKNGNMKMDELEAEALYRDLERSLLRKYEQASLKDTYLSICKFVFLKAENGGMFGTDEVCVSTKTQSELASSLAFSSLLGFFGGPAIFILGLWMLISQIN